MHMQTKKGKEKKEKKTARRLSVKTVQTACKNCCELRDPITRPRPCFVSRRLGPSELHPTISIGRPEASNTRAPS